MKNTLSLIISLAILLMPIDSNGYIGGSKELGNAVYLYTCYPPNWTVANHTFYTTKHNYDIVGNGTCTREDSNYEPARDIGLNRRSAPVDSLTYTIRLTFEYFRIEQKFKETANINVITNRMRAPAGTTESYDFRFVTEGRWPVDPLLYYSPSEGLLWNLATYSSSNCENHPSCIPMDFPLSVMNALPDAQLEQLADEARSAPPPRCNPNALGPPTIVSPPKDGSPLFRSKNVPFYFEIPDCKFTDYTKNAFSIEAQERKLSSNSDTVTYLPWKPLPLADWSLIKMKPALWDKDIRSFGAKNIRVGTKEKYAEIRYRIKGIIWQRDKFHSTPFTEWQYFRVGKPTLDGAHKHLSDKGPVGIGLSDLSPHSFQAIPGIITDQNGVSQHKIQFRFLIQNKGTGSIPEGTRLQADLECFMNGEPCPDWNKIFAATYDREDLWPGGFDYSHIEVNRPPGDTYYQFKLTLDPKNWIEEDREDNNEAIFNYFSPALKFTPKTPPPSLVKLPEAISTTGLTLSQKAFNLKDAVPITLPAKTASLQFQHREGSFWRMSPMPRKLSVKEIKVAKGKIYRQTYKFDQTGHYRYRWRSTNGTWSGWQEFEIKGDKKKGQTAAVRPKTTRALVPAIKPNEGAGSPGKGGTVQPDTLKPPRISSLRTGKIFSADDQIKLKAEYNRSHKVTFVLQRKHGNSYRTLKKIGHGDLGKLDPGAYRVGVVYAGGRALPDKWIKFNVAKAKKLKVPPSATKKLDPGSSSNKKITIDLK